jgi:hypothetical protein
MMHKGQLDTPFSERLLEKTPLNYRFMYSTITETIGELRMRSKFSKSGRHMANQYLNYSLNKPCSNFYLPETNIDDPINE